jgi:hypothetical protein
MLVTIPKVFPPRSTKADIIMCLRDLQKEHEELKEKYDALEAGLAQIRSCRDARCHMCPQCVTTAFVRIDPAPLTIPQKYVTSQETER